MTQLQSRTKWRVLCYQPARWPKWPGGHTTPASSYIDCFDIASKATARAIAARKNKDCAPNRYWIESYTD